MEGNSKGIEDGKSPVVPVVYPFPISYELLLSSRYGDSFPCCVLLLANVC